MKFIICLVLFAFAATIQAEVNFNYPVRDYSSVGGSWSIFYEKDMEKASSELARKSVAKLIDALSSIEKQLPERSLRELKTLKIFLMWGEDSPSGGNKSGMRFVRRGETERQSHYDKRWEHSIVIYSAKNLMYLTDMWTKKALVHELSHAWHIMHWPEKYAPIVKAWENAKSNNLYINVKDYRGNIKPEAYAIKNQLEYFAELSAVYFVGGDYFPFNQQGLVRYDPAGAAMVENLWSVK